jgi:hypothetical protein
MQNQATSGLEECPLKYRRTGATNSLLQQNTEQGQEKLLPNPNEIICSREDTGTFPHVSLRTRVPPAHRPHCVNEAHEC